MINRCIRCITLGLTQYIIDLEKMYLRISQQKAAISSLQDKTEMAELRSDVTQMGSPRTLDQAAALRALLSEHKGAMLKESILNHRTGPILTRAQTFKQITPMQHQGLSHICVTKILVIMPKQKTT